MPQNHIRRAQPSSETDTSLLRPLHNMGVKIYFVCVDESVTELERKDPGPSDNYETGLSLGLRNAQATNHYSTRPSEHTIRMTFSLWQRGGQNDVVNHPLHRRDRSGMVDTPRLRYAFACSSPFWYARIFRKPAPIKSRSLATACYVLPVCRRMETPLAISPTVPCENASRWLR